MLRAGAHGLTGGGMSAMEGGDFWSGAAGGFAGSLGASALGDLGLGSVGYGISGAASGALGSWAAGGDPWQGALSGGLIGLFNHDLHGVPHMHGTLPEVVVQGKSSSNGIAGLVAGAGGLIYPVSSKFRITSPFTTGNRNIPELGLNRPHLGIDIGTPYGTPIQSPWSGKVVMAKDTEYGLSVVIKHDYMYQGKYIQTGYVHLSKMNVTNGMRIERGAVLGNTGTWGTGPHLHLTLRVGNQKVNPTNLFPYY